MSDELPEMLTVKEAAAYLRLSVGTLRRWIHNGRIKVVTFPGGDQRVKVTDLMSFIEEVQRKQKTR